jgi:hypothetical protein
MPQRSVLSGDLASISIADILTLLSMSRKTGLLTCRRQSAEKGIYWSNGEITFSVSNLPEDSLGEFLVTRGRLGRVDLERASQKVSARLRLGKVLVREGLLTPHDLWWAVQTQVQEIIYSLFQWQEGSFDFTEGVESEVEKIQLGNSTQNLIMEGIRRLDEWSRIRERIPDPTLVPVLRLAAEEIERRVELRDHDRRVLALIDGQRSVRVLVQESGAGEFEAQLALLGLVSAGYVDLRGTAPVPPSMARFLEIDDDPILAEQIRHFNELYTDLFRHVQEKLGGETRSRLQTLLDHADYEGKEALAGVHVGEDGSLAENEVLSNIADLPLEERSRSLWLGLNNHLLAQFLEFGGLLNGDQKAELYRRIQEHQKRIEKETHA